MRRVTKENLIVQIDRLYKIKDEQGQLSMNDEYNLQVYKTLLATMDANPVYTSSQPEMVVPDEIPKFKDRRGFKYVKDGICYSVNYANGWNQCRAAMLNQK